MLVTKSCLTLCDPMDCSLPGSSVHGDSLAGIMEWVAIPFTGDLPDTGSNSGLLHYKWIPCHLSHQGRPWRSLASTKSAGQVG